MVEVVYVHGVSVRKDANDLANGTGQYSKGVAERQENLRRHCFVGNDVNFRDPYWGHFGAKPDTGLVSIPNRDLSYVSLGWGSAKASVSTDLLSSARSDFGALIDAFCLVLRAQEDDSDSQKLADRLAVYAAAYDGDEVESSVRAPGWVNDGSVQTDDQFVLRLEQEVSSIEVDVPLGFVGNLLGKAKDKLVDTGLHIVDGPAERYVRKFTPFVADFLGDTFVYLREAQQRQQIRDVVLEALIEACRDAKEANSKFIAIGHSMGANILYDILSDPETTTHAQDVLGAPLRLDLMLTVGTQVGLFEELNLFVQSSPQGPIPRPATIADWWHVFNQMDVLSFRASPVFAGVKEFSIDTRAHMFDAHSSYFRSDVFLHRLRKRLLSHGLIA